MQRNCGIALVLPLCIVASLYFHLSINLRNSIFPASLEALLGDSSLPHKVEKATSIQVDPSYSIQNENIGILRNEISPKRNTTIPSHLPYEMFSSVDSFTCCGLGHRMTRVAMAAHLANYLGLALRVFWAFCLDVEVFHYFFGPQPREEMMHVNTTGTTVRVHNEIPGYGRFIREGPNVTCKCSKDKIVSDANFYTGLRNRFRHKQEVDEFVETVFADNTVVGMHIRAGNGETGDFQRKNRSINDVDAWVHRMARNIRNMTSDWKKPLLLFIATDTPSMIEKFRTSLTGIMNVTDYAQERANEGGGVFFGEMGSFHPDVGEKDKCLNGWDGMLKDMFVLSHADVVVAARPSSFVQTLPMSLVFDKPKKIRSVMRPYCETNLAGSELRCFEDYMDWCCNGIGSFVFDGLNQRYEYVKQPFGVEKQNYTLTKRKQNCMFKNTDGSAKRTCIPFSWPTN